MPIVETQTPLDLTRAETIRDVLADACLLDFLYAQSNLGVPCLPSAREMPPAYQQAAKYLRGEEHVDMTDSIAKIIAAAIGQRRAPLNLPSGIGEPALQFKAAKAYCRYYGTPVQPQKPPQPADKAGRDDFLSLGIVRAQIEHKTSLYGPVLRALSGESLTQIAVDETAIAIFDPSDSIRATAYRDHLLEKLGTLIGQPIALPKGDRLGEDHAIRACENLAQAIEMMPKNGGIALNPHVVRQLEQSERVF